MISNIKSTMFWLSHRKRIFFRFNWVLIWTFNRTWSFSKFNQSEKQRFSLNLVIQFVEIPNDVVFYGAPAPKVTPYLSNVFFFLKFNFINKIQKKKGCSIPILRCEIIQRDLTKRDFNAWDFYFSFILRI